jgi:hypothetical protein
MDKEASGMGEAAFGEIFFLELISQNPEQIDNNRVLKHFGSHVVVELSLLVNPVVDTSSFHVFVIWPIV